MGRVKYDHKPGNVYLMEWVDFDGQPCHCLGLIVQVKQGQTARLTDQMYAMLFIYSRRGTPSGFSTTARWCTRASVNTMARRSGDVSKRRLEIVMIFGTTLGNMFGKAFTRYKKNYSRYYTHLDCDKIEAVLPK